MELNRTAKEQASEIRQHEELMVYIASADYLSEEDKELLTKAMIEERKLYIGYLRATIQALRERRNGR
jgi:hypothetical protein